MLAATDPNLFHLNWDRTAEALIGIVVLSMIVERALSWLFESEWYIKKLAPRHIKPQIAFVVSLVICVYWDFDAVSIIILAEKTNWLGAAITAGVIAGGSKGSIKLFRDFMGFKSEAQKTWEAGKAAAAGGGDDEPAPATKKKTKKKTGT